MPSSRQRKLDAVVARLQLQYGPAAVRKAAPPAEPVARLSTTFPELDGALSGGLPRGRITEIIGAATSGKATLAAKVWAAAHAERNALVAWLDLPRTSDPDYLHRCGVDLRRLLVVCPRDGADALAITLHLVESVTLAALIFDATAQSGDSTPPDPATLAGSLERLAQLDTSSPKPTGLVWSHEQLAGQGPLRWRVAVATRESRQSDRLRRSLLWYLPCQRTAGLVRCPGAQAAAAPRLAR